MLNWQIFNIGTFLPIYLLPIFIKLIISVFYECKLLFLHTQLILSLNNEVSSLIHITYTLDHSYTPASNTYDLHSSLTVRGEYSIYKLAAQV